MTQKPANPGELIFLDPESGLEIRAVSPSERAAVEALIRSDAGETLAATMLESLVEIPDAQVFVAKRHHAIVATYALRKDGLTNDLPVIVVATTHRRQGIGRAMLQDALRRSGRRPLAAQTPEGELTFFKTCGFKLVGRRVQPSGDVWFRVGWHAPGARFKGGTTSALDHLRTPRSTENDA